MVVEALLHQLRLYKDQMHCNVCEKPRKLSPWGDGLYELLYSWLWAFGQLQPLLNQSRRGCVEFVLEIHAFEFFFNVTAGVTSHGTRRTV
jgi:hypothetical protein